MLVRLCLWVWHPCTRSKQRVLLTCIYGSMQPELAADADCASCGHLPTGMHLNAPCHTTFKSPQRRALSDTFWASFITAAPSLTACRPACDWQLGTLPGPGASMPPPPAAQRPHPDALSAAFTLPPGSHVLPEVRRESSMRELGADATVASACWGIGDYAGHHAACHHA